MASTLTTAEADEEPDEPESDAKTDDLDELTEVVSEAGEKKARGNYDLSVMERDNPRLVAIVAWLLTIPGMSWRVAAKQAGMAWRTVAAIAARRTADMAEFRHRSAQMIALVLEASGPGLLKRAVDGKLNAFEFKQLVDAWGILSAQASVRVEHTINLNVTQAEADLMRIVDVGSRNITQGACHNLVEVMGSESQKVHALPAPADPAPDPQP